MMREQSWRSNHVVFFRVNALMGVDLDLSLFLRKKKHSQKVTTTVVDRTTENRIPMLISSFTCNNTAWLSRCTGRLGCCSKKKRWHHWILAPVALLLFADVDTPEPDEKSIITYVSQLYDVFPEPPPGHPLFDVEAQKRLQQFRDLASSLHQWIKEQIVVMQVRHSQRTIWDDD